MSWRTHSFHRYTVLACTTAAVLCTSTALFAGPLATAPADPMARLLQDKGVTFNAPVSDAKSSLPATTSSASPQNIGFVQHMRDSASEMVISAMNFLGVRYRRGGNSAEDGFDCSGFTRYVFEHSLGLILPRRADEQASAPGLQKVQRNELKPGDLVFFNTLRRTFSHVGIYVGEGKFIHAPRTGANVRVEDMRYSYWSNRFTGARRPTPSDSEEALARNNPLAPRSSAPPQAAANPLAQSATTPP